MGFLIPIGAVLWGTIAVSVTTVVGALIALVSAVASVLVTIAAAVYGVVAGTVAGVLSGLGIISNVTAIHGLISFHALNAVSAIVYTNVAIGVALAKAAFIRFLEIIHFKLLMQIHEIAYLVSGDYRELTNKVYKEIARFSTAVNLGSSFIPLALENARSVVLDVSGMMGRPYDIGQIQWLSTLNRWAEHVKEVGLQYTDSPGAVFEDINELIIKPHVDTKSSIVQNLFLTIEKGLAGSEAIIGKTAKLRKDVDKLVHDLPSVLRSQIEIPLSTITSKFDNFINTTYRPAIDQISKMTNILSTDMVKEKQKLSDLADRLRRPGDYLQEIDSLPDSERASQEDIISELGTRTILRDVASRSEEVEGVTIQLDKIGALLDETIKHPAWDVRKTTIDMIRDTIGQDESKTWYVGDF